MAESIKGGYQVKLLLIANTRPLQFGAEVKIRGSGRWVEEIRIAAQK